MYFQTVIQMVEVEVFVDVLEEDKGKGEITYKRSPLIKNFIDLLTN